MKKLSVIVPARDEGAVIKETVEGLVAQVGAEDCEILIIDDHSKDDTSLVSGMLASVYPGVVLIKNTGPPGFASALKAGFKRATGEFAVPFMADGCDDPADLLPMLEKAERGCDLVCASRYTKGGKRLGGPFLQGLFSRFVGVTLHYLAGIPTMDCSNAFKLYRRSILMSLNLREEGFAVSMEASLKFFAAGCTICDVATVWKGRKKGKSKFRISRTYPYIRLFLLAVLWPAGRKRL